MSEPQPDEKLSEAFVPEELLVTSTAAFLVIARYNRSSWNRLGTIPWGDSGKTLQDAAHDQAETAIPEGLEGKAPTAARPGPQPFSFLPGAQQVWSFDTALHISLKNAFVQYARSLPTAANTAIQVPEAVSKPIVEAQLSARPSDGSDPGIGWAAVVDAARINAFFEHLGGRYSPLCQMYDIEVIPLNWDRNTNDLYQFMTPVNWRK